MTVQVAKRLFTVDEYHQMGRAGILREQDRVELIEGEVLSMSPIGSRHAACVDRLTFLFSRCLAQRAIVRVQNPVRLGQHSEPQPDVALLRPRADFYRAAHPGPDDVLLIVEVAERSADFDREVKVPLYAAAAVAEVWLVDLAAGAVTVYRQPAGRQYGQQRTMGRGQTLTPQALPGVQIAVADVIG